MKMMTKIAPAFLCAVLLLSIGACKKDDTSAGLSVTGKYRLVNSTNPLPQYIMFNEDKTYVNLQQTPQGAHQISKGVYSINNSVLTLSEYYSLFLIQNTGDTLKLLASPGQPSSSDKILVPDAATPDQDTWVQPVTTTQQIATANLNLSGMAVVGTKLYTVYQYDTYMHIFDLASNMELPQIDVGDYYRAFTNSGGNLYAAKTNNDLLKLNTSGTVSATYSGVTNQQYVLAGNGAVIYSYSSPNQRLSSYNTATSTNGSDGNFEQNLTSLCFKGGYLYGTYYNYLYKIDPATFTVVKSYHLPANQSASAIASDGTGIWLQIDGGLYNTGYIAKVTLD